MIMYALVVTILLHSFANDVESQVLDEESGMFTCKDGTVIPEDKQCNFNHECANDRSDESNCNSRFGMCNLENGPCGWTKESTEISLGSQWKISSYDDGVTYDQINDHNGGKEKYWKITGQSDSKKRSARIVSPVIQAAVGGSCRIRFYIYIHGSTQENNHVKLFVRDDLSGEQTLSTTFDPSGDTWHFKIVNVGRYYSFFEVVIEGLVGHYRSVILVDDISMSQGCRQVKRQQQPFLKLAGGEHSNEGRVEVFHKGLWGTLCDDEFGMEEGTVVCKQLGYGGVANVYRHSTFGSGRGKVWMDHLNCQGDEVDVRDCFHGGWGSRECDIYHRRDASVECMVEENADLNRIRLRGGSKPNEGRLEVWSATAPPSEKTWTTINSGKFGLVDARVACRQLGFEDAADVKDFGSPGSGIRSLLESVRCLGHETSLASCELKWGSGYSQHVGVVCIDRANPIDGILKLTGGYSPNMGRLEILYKQQWVKICRDGWELEDTNIACRELERGLLNRTFANESTDVIPIETTDRPMSITHVNCSRDANRIGDCEHSTLDNVNCTNDVEVMIICRGRSQSSLTVNSRKELLVDFHGELRPVSTQRFSFTTLNVICKELGFKGFLSNVNVYGRMPDAPMIGSGVECRGHEYSLKACKNHDWFEEPRNFTRHTHNPFYYSHYIPIQCTRENHQLMVRGGCRYDKFSVYHRVFESYGVLWSPGYPNNYPSSSTQCKWQIYTVEKKQVLVEIKDISTVPGDILRVSTQSLELVTVQGTDGANVSPPSANWTEISSMDTFVQITFNTNARNGSTTRGFYAMFYIRDIPKIPCDVSTYPPGYEPKVKPSPTEAPVPRSEVLTFLILFAITMSPMSVLCVWTCFRDCIRGTYVRKRHHSVEYWPPCDVNIRVQDFHHKNLDGSFEGKPKSNFDSLRVKQDDVNE